MTTGFFEKIAGIGVILVTEQLFRSSDWIQVSVPFLKGLFHNGSKLPRGGLAAVTTRAAAANNAENAN